MSPSRRAWVTVGTYDGVHLGHQALLRDLAERAERKGLKSLAVVFPHPPRLFFNPSLKPSLLTLPRERAGLIKSLGIERVVFLPFDRRVAELSRESFLEDYLIGRLGAGGFYVGADFIFGRDRRGNLDFLKAECRRRGLPLRIRPLLKSNGAKLGSTSIRERLARGDVDGVRRMLGRPYGLAGKVVKGAGLGARLGYPTANLAVHPDKLLPPGVFEVRAELGQASYPAVANIGTRPTLQGPPRLVVEAHLLGLRRPLYGRLLTLKFLRKIRDEKKFPDLDALRAQIKLDVESLGSPR